MIDLDAIRKRARINDLTGYSNGDVPALLAHVAALEAERDTLMRQLHSLTPGGSEFYASPDNCVRWVQERLQSQQRLLVQHSIRRQQAEAARAALAAERAELLRICQAYLHNHKEWEWECACDICAAARAALAATRPATEGRSRQ